MTVELAQATKVLRAWQVPTNPVAYRCPAGHGVLGLYRDRAAQAGIVLACAACAHRVTVSPDVLGPAASATRLPGTMEPLPEGGGIPLLPNGSAPRGQLADGLVRTSGWLLVGNRVVGSGLLCALLGAGLAVALVPAEPAWAAAAAVLGFALWRVFARWLRPCSRARNLDRVTAAELAEGMFVRRYGQIGPVARVESATPWTDGMIAVHFTGGGQERWAPARRVWVAELLD